MGAKLKLVKGRIPIRRYRVTTPDGDDEFDAHYMFNSDAGNGDILFRRYVDDDTNGYTDIVAQYARGYWLRVQIVKESSDGK